jgi:hypothetical protein
MARGGGVPGDRDASTVRLPDYLRPLMDRDSEPARPFIDLLSSAWVRHVSLTSPSEQHPSADAAAAPAGDLPSAAVVTIAPGLDVMRVEHSLVGDAADTDTAAGTALRRLIDAIPAPDWHVASTLRADIQHWLSRRSVAGDLLRDVYG